MEGPTDEPAPPLFIVKGELLQQQGLFRTWKRRWFTLTHEAIVRYQDQQLTRVTQRYLLTGGTFNVVDLSNKYTMRIEFQGKRQGTRSIQLRALNKDDFAKWWDALCTFRAKSTTELEPINANKVFGVDLATLKAAGVAFDEARNLPTVVITCVEFLLEGDRIAEQGIFRLAGDHQRIQALRDSVDQGRPLQLEASENVNNVSGLLKLYLRSLPQPLLLFDNYETIISCCREKESELPEVLKQVVASLPAEHKSLVAYISAMLLKVAAKSEVNKMGMNNLATVFAPSLLRTKIEDPMKMMNENDYLTRATLAVVQRSAELFGADGPTGA